MTMHDLTRIMHKTALEPMSVMLAGRVEFARGQQVRSHHHTTWELVYYLEGQIQCVVEERSYEARPGVLLAIPPHTAHYELSLTPWACYYIEIVAPPQQPWPRQYDDASGAFGSLCSLLVNEWGRQQPEREAMLSTLVTQIDILLRRTHAAWQLCAAERLVREAERCLEERFEKRITVNEVAREVGVSETYLRRQFMRRRGRTPLDYLHSLRLQHALALIGNSDLSLEVIATISGYDSASHLSRYVKRATGKSPGSLRGQRMS